MLRKKTLRRRKMNHEISSDSDKSKELEEKLVRDNYGLVVSQALSFLEKNPLTTLDDYIQVGLIGLLKAIRKFDEKKAKFSTFAVVCIRNELLNHVRKYKKKNKVIFNDNITKRAIKQNAYISKENLFEYTPDHITQEQNFILKLKLENHNNREICDLLSCTRRELDNKIRELIVVLREANR